jgi:phage gp29-like protein
MTTTNSFTLKGLVASVANAFKPNAKTLTTETAAAEAGAGATRRVVDDFNTTGFTPVKMASLLAQASDLTNIASYFSMAENLEESDMQFRSLIGTRKLAVAGLELVVEPFDTSRQAKKVAELVRSVLTSDAFESVLLDILDALSKGVSMVEIMWDTSGVQWLPVGFKRREQRWFEFDKTDGTTVKLRGPAGTQVDLEPNKFIIHKPLLKSGLPIRSGLAMSAAWAWVIKSLILADWLAFCEVYGQPFRIGKYEQGTKKEDVVGLKRALESLGTNAYAVLPRTMAVEFVNAGGATGNSDLFEQIIRYLDEQLAKLILGQTLTSGSGSKGAGGGTSQALGKVHNEVRADLLRADAKQLAATILRDLVTPLVAFNFGADVPLPKVHFQIDEPEDLVGLATILEKTVPLGFKVPQKWARDKFGVPEAEDGEDLLEIAAPAPVVAPAAPVVPDKPAAAANSRAPACPVHSAAHTEGPRDALDGLTDYMTDEWVAVGGTIESKMLLAIGDAKDLAEMQARLVEFVSKGDLDDLAGLIGNARAIAHLVGRANGDIGGT